MEAVIIGILSILATCGWWVIGVWGFELNAFLFGVIFLLDGLLSVLLLKWFGVKIQTFWEGE